MAYIPYTKKKDHTKVNEKFLATKLNKNTEHALAYIRDKKERKREKLKNSQWSDKDDDSTNVKINSIQRKNYLGTVGRGKFVSKTRFEPYFDESSKQIGKFRDVVYINVKGGNGGKGNPNYGGVGGDGGDAIIIGKEDTDRLPPAGRYIAGL